MERIIRIAVAISLAIASFLFCSCAQKDAQQIGDELTVYISSDSDWTAWMRSDNYTFRQVVISEGVTTIPDYAFAFCPYLETVDLPDSLIYIGNHAFLECYSLQSLHLPKSVSHIGNSAFETYSDNISITVDGENPYFVMSDDVLYSSDYYTAYFCNPTATEIVFHADTKRIAAYALISDLQPEITLPEDLLYIEEAAFLCSGRLTSSELPKSLISVAGGALTSLQMNELSINSYTDFVPDDLSEDVFPATMRRLIIYGDDFILHPYMFSDTKHPLELVFTGNTPMDCSDCQASTIEKLSEYQEVTIYYLIENSDLWSPNGETEWNGFPIVAIKSLNSLPQIGA